MSTHLEESLQRDFDRIRAAITKMAETAVRTLRDCVGAIEKRDRQYALMIILRDQRIDQMQKEIDRLCLEFLLRHQPAGVHLRFAYTALQVNFELERVGDYAESIAQQILKLIELNCPIPAELFREISTASISMLQNAVAAFVRRDADLATVTAQIEEQVDVQRNQVNSELLHLVQSNRLPLAALAPLMTIARRFERVSDQAKSMCQETIYICTGEYTKHAGSNLYRVLFVDAAHGWLSSMAEAIGHALLRSDFNFASATSQPKPFGPDFRRFLEEKGLVLPRETALAFSDLVALEPFQAVIALSAGSQGQTPTPSRKGVTLDWSLPAVSGASAAPRDQWDQAYNHLSKQIAEFVNALVGEEHNETIELHK